MSKKTDSEATHPLLEGDSRHGVLPVESCFTKPPRPLLIELVESPRGKELLPGPPELGGPP